MSFEILIKTIIELLPTVFIITIIISLIRSFLRAILNSINPMDNKIPENTNENKEIKNPKMNIKKIKNKISGMDHFKEYDESIEAKRNKLIEELKKGE